MIKDELREVIIELLEGYKFPIMTETNEYGDNEEVTRNDLITALLPIIAKYAPSLCEVDEGKVLTILMGKISVGYGITERLTVPEESLKRFAHTLATTPETIRLRG